MKLTLRQRLWCWFYCGIGWVPANHHYLGCPRNPMTKWWREKRYE